MAKYKVGFKPSAIKELKELDDPLLARIVAAIESFQADPRPVGCRKLKGNKNLWRIRVGEYHRLPISDSQLKLSVFATLQECTNNLFARLAPVPRLAY